MKVLMLCLLAVSTAAFADYDMNRTDSKRAINILKNSGATVMEAMGMNFVSLKTISCSEQAVAPLEQQCIGSDRFNPAADMLRLKSAATLIRLMKKAGVQAAQSPRDGGRIYTVESLDCGFDNDSSEIQDARCSFEL